MDKSELLDLIVRSEDSTPEFKRDGVENQELAKELVAFLNLDGGVVLLGVEDDGRISGVHRNDIEEWVAELCRTKIEPPVVPLLSWVRNAEPGQDVLSIRLTSGPDKPYARVHRGRKTYFIRVGSTSREASREEMQRMYQASGHLRYGLKPVPGATFDALDWRRLRDYLVHILGGTAPVDSQDREEWETLLLNLDLMTVSAGQHVATVDGLLLFGRSPNRHVPQSGIRAICYPGTDPDYAARADQDLRSSMVPLGAADGSIVEIGLGLRASQHHAIGAPRQGSAN